MNQPHASRLLGVLTSLAFVTLSAATAQTVRSVHTFATGSAVGATGPDSVVLGTHSVWVAYINGADSTGASGSSTVVQYRLNGSVRKTYSFAGSVDGLQIDPRNGDVWAMQNQDGNSTLTLIEPGENEVLAPKEYADKSSSNGYDDAAFRLNQVFLSYTNPASASSPTIQLVKNGTDPIEVTPILRKGALGTNLATGQTNQPTTQNDPDSLRLTPTGDLMLSSGDDGQLIFVENPGTRKQSVSFLSLIDPKTGGHVSGLDDALFATAEKGTFYLADTSNNRILKIAVDNIPVGSLFASIGSLNELAIVDRFTGGVYPVVAHLHGPHGLQFVPASEEDNDEACEVNGK